MIKNIKSQLIGKLWGMESIEINFNKVKNQKVISRIEKSFFRPGELKDTGTSSFSILSRRTLAQFLGQKYWIRTEWIYIIRCLLSIAALPFSILVPLIKNLRFPRKAKKKTKVVSFLEVEFCKPFLDEIFPDGYTVVSPCNTELNFKDVGFILKILFACPRYLIYPELLCRVIIGIAQYSYVINQYHPEVISNFAEGSCWASVLTGYCRELGIKHINIMHGIRYFSSSKAFSEFDTFYVWGKYHLEQFKMMRVSAKNFIISGNPIHRRLRKTALNTIPKQPPRLLIMCEFILLADRRFFFLICDIINQIGSEWAIICRLHYQDIEYSIRFAKKLEYKLQRKVIIEHPCKVPFKDSIRRATIVVGSYTNALTDAWVAGKKCIYLHLPEEDRIPLQEYHYSKNIKIFCRGDKIQNFLNVLIVEDESETILRNRFSRNI